MVEQRYQAVLEVLDDIPVTEVAERFGVTHQTVHRWVARYRESGPQLATVSACGVPAELTGQPQLPAAAGEPEPDDGAATPPPPDPGSDSGQGKAVELDRLVPSSATSGSPGSRSGSGPR